MPKTVKVRIAVAINENGKWSAYGHSGEHRDRAFRAQAESDIDYNSSQCHSIYWLEADLEIPEAKTIQAKVEREPHGN